LYSGFAISNISKTVSVFSARTIKYIKNGPLSCETINSAQSFEQDIKRMTLQKKHQHLEPRNNGGNLDQHPLSSSSDILIKNTLAD